MPEATTESSFIETAKKGRKPQPRKEKMPREKKVKDPNAPKRAQSAYMFFSVDTRAALKKENPEATFASLSTMVGMAWKCASEAEKEVAQGKADADKERYTRDMEVTK